jgi:phosphate transport system protein
MGTGEGKAQLEELRGLAASACETARGAINLAIGILTSGDHELFARIADLEEQLDAIDRQFDDRAATAFVGLTEAETRELLACAKLMVDLERVGDLISSFACRAEALGERLSTVDSQDLLRMASVLEVMVTEAEQAFFKRDMVKADGVLRKDGEIDRLRNLICFRHLHDHDGVAGPDSIHVIMLAQLLERAGDHLTNVAEEACHLVLGHSVRHPHIRQGRSPVELREQLQKSAKR